MISESFIYWFTRLDHLHSFITSFYPLPIIFCVISFMVWICCSIGKICVKDDNDVELESILAKIASCLKKTFVWAFIIALSLSIVRTMLPTTKEMAAIYVIPKIANNENVQEVGSEIMTLAKEWLKELHPTNVTAKVNKTQKK